MEQVAQSTFYHLHVAPLYWWSVGAFAVGITGLVWCLWQGVKNAMAAEVCGNKKASLVRARETGGTR